MRKLLTGMALGTIIGLVMAALLIGIDWLDHHR